MVKPLSITTPVDNWNPQTPAFYICREINHNCLRKFWKFKNSKPLAIYLRLVAIFGTFGFIWLLRWFYPINTDPNSTQNYPQFTHKFANNITMIFQVLFILSLKICWEIEMVLKPFVHFSPKMIPLVCIYSNFGLLWKAIKKNTKSEKGHMTLSISINGMVDAAVHWLKNISPSLNPKLFKFNDFGQF